MASLVYAKHHAKEKRAAAHRRWKMKNPERSAEIARKITRSSNLRGKLEVLAYYGKGGKIKCCWRGCEITDPDMLTLDHVNNDGHKEHQGLRGGGAEMKRTLQKQGWPEHFQTLCWNHQWKKEIQRRRDGRI